MKNIKPVSNCDDGDDGSFFNPATQKPNSNNPYAKLCCCCGYELIKESDGTFRCTGGNHRYLISEGEVCFDKFGNTLLKLPQGENNKNGNTK